MLRWTDLKTQTGSGSNLPVRLYGLLASFRLDMAQHRPSRLLPSGPTKSHSHSHISALCQSHAGGPPPLPRDMHSRVKACHLVSVSRLNSRPCSPRRCCPAAQALSTRPAPSTDTIISPRQPSHSYARWLP